MKECESSSCSEMTIGKHCAHCLGKKVAELERTIHSLEAQLQRSEKEKEELRTRLRQQRQTDLDALCGGIGNSIGELLKVVKTIDAITQSKSRATRKVLDAALSELKEGTVLPQLNARLDVTSVLELVSLELGVSVGYLCGPSKKPGFVRARHLAIAVLRRLTDASYPDLGIVFHRHHTSIMHSSRAIARRNDRADVERLVEIIKTKTEEA